MKCGESTCVNPDHMEDLANQKSKMESEIERLLTTYDLDDDTKRALQQVQSSLKKGETDANQRPR